MIISVCSGVVTTITRKSLNFTVGSNFTLPIDNACSTIKIRLLPKEQYGIQIGKIFTSLAITSETQQSKLKLMFVYNKNGKYIHETMIAPF